MKRNTSASLGVSDSIRGGGRGIVAHTGFLVFGASSLLGDFLPGNLMLIPWFAPAVIGVAVIAFLVVRYARSFGHYASRTAAGSAVN